MKALYLMDNVRLTRPIIKAIYICVFLDPENRRISSSPSSHRPGQYIQYTMVDDTRDANVLSAGNASLVSRPYLHPFIEGLEDLILGVIYF